MLILLCLPSTMAQRISKLGRFWGKIEKFCATGKTVAALHWGLFLPIKKGKIPTRPVERTCGCPKKFNAMPNRRSQVAYSA